MLFVPPDAAGHQSPRPGARIATPARG